MGRSSVHTFICDACGAIRKSEANCLPEGWADVALLLRGANDPYNKQDVELTTLVCGACQNRIIDRLNDGEWAELLARDPAARA